MSEFRIIEGDCIEAMRGLDDGTAQTCVTSPPYWGLRDYGHEGQLGLEPTPEEYVADLVAVFREVRRVLRDDGTLWLNLGDSYYSNPKGNPGDVGNIGKPQVANVEQAGAYTKGTPEGMRAAGIKIKDLVGIPWMVAFALRADGWYLRSEIIWHKPAPMPEPVRDRPTKSHEQIFLLTKSPRYFYDAEAIREPATDALPHSPGKRSVWTVNTTPFPGAHFATFPPKLIDPCILAGSSTGDTILDPFSGAGTTGLVALRHDRDYIGCELNPEYAQMSRERITDDAPLLNYEAA